MSSDDPVSGADDEAQDETDYLLRVPANARRLLESLSHARGIDRAEAARLMREMEALRASGSIDPDELESWEETIAVLSDPHLMASLRESEAEIARGEEGIPLDQVIAAMALGKQAVIDLDAVGYEQTDEEIEIARRAAIASINEEPWE